MMKKSVLLFTWLLMFIFLTSCAEKSDSIIADGANVEKLADGFSFTEGPVADKFGNVYFTDQPNDRIWKYSTDGELSLFAEGMGRANGLYFDDDGYLFSCSDMDNEIWCINVSDKEHETVISGFGNAKFNGPNDLWVHPDGGIYFTDPFYARDYWTRDHNMQIDGEHVYFLPEGGKQAIRVISDLEKPNGIIGTPDGKLLYVADIGAGKTYVYNILKDGTLTGKREFAPMGSDGMTIDNEGNIYITGNGVTVFNPKGEQIAHIPVEADWTANVCFGGKDMKTLFITASEYLYGLRMNVTGAVK